ncbi:hypothetical protein D3C73_1040800 [compost metagenome]
MLSQITDSKGTVHIEVLQHTFEFSQNLRLVQPFYVYEIYICLRIFADREMHRLQIGVLDLVAEQREIGSNVGDGKIRPVIQPFQKPRPIRLRIGLGFQRCGHIFLEAKCIHDGWNIDQHTGMAMNVD